jgi:glycosyltransferase involved in cell wall biosynthesis
MDSENSVKQNCYVIITPVRDEAQHIEQTLKSVTQQTVKPAAWVIVDDGSTDGTPGIIDRFSAQHSWISTLHAPREGPRVNGSRVMEAFYRGYSSMASLDWDFLVKLDGDVSLEPDYFERCFEEFRKDPSLGIGGGLIWSPFDGIFKPEPCPLNHVRGATKIYHRACWQAIGELLRAPGWDTLDEVKAMMLGWNVRTFRDLKVLHYRPTGGADGTWRDAVKNGRADFICGYHPLFMLAKYLKRLFQKPLLIGGAGHFYGFATAFLEGIPQVPDKALIRYVRQQQMRRLLLRESIWR